MHIFISMEKKLLSPVKTARTNRTIQISKQTKTVCLVGLFVDKLQLSDGETHRRRVELVEE